VVARGVLDEECPNVTLHRGTDGDRRHPVDHAAWLRLLREQLGRTLDDGVVPLGKQGARGVLFQVTLLAYGYTFVSKGTTARFVQELEHEAKVYERLRPLQGVRVPVFLGAVDLREVGRTYYYDGEVHIIYLMLVSWGGCSLDEVEVSDRAKVNRGVVGSVRALHVHGVVHTDVRDANVLWDEETERVMVIDFEQAVLEEPPRRALAPVVPNKRARRTDVDANTAAGKPKSKNDAQQLKIRFLMQDDILAATMILRTR
jgi:predicted Ser/Thr protein kinase